MKKLPLFLMALLATFVVACNNQEKTEEVETEVVEETLENVSEENNANADLPQFENADLTAYVVEFNTFFNESLALLKAGDMKGLEALEAKGKEIEAKGEEFKNNISEADKAKLEAYLQAKATEMLSASGLEEMMKNAGESTTK